MFELTKRENEICKAFIKSRGGTNCCDIIAKDLNISKATAKTHLNNIYLKLLVRNKAELMYVLMKRKINGQFQEDGTSSK